MRPYTSHVLKWTLHASVDSLDGCGVTRHDDLAMGPFITAPEMSSYFPHADAGRARKKLSGSFVQAGAVGRTDAS